MNFIAPVGLQADMRLYLHDRERLAALGEYAQDQPIFSTADRIYNLNEIASERQDAERRATDPRVLKEEEQLAAEQAKRGNVETVRLDRQLQNVPVDQQKKERDAARLEREVREKRERRDLLERQRDREQRERARAETARAQDRGRSGKGDDGREM